MSPASLLPVLSAMLLLLFPLPRLSCQEKKGLEDLLREARAELSALQARSQKEARAREETRRTLMEELLALEKKEARLAKDLARTRREEARAGKALEEARREEARRSEALGNLDRLLERTLPRLLSRTADSLAALGSPRFQELRESLRTAWETSRNPAGSAPPPAPLSLLETSLDLALAEAEEGARLRWFRDLFPGPQGPPVRARLLRAGLLGAAGPEGVLVPRSGSWALFRPGGILSGRRIARALERLRPGGGPLPALPLDVTGGLALAGLSSSRSLTRLFSQGGPVMYFILLAGITGLLISLFRGAGIWLERRRLARLGRTLPALLREGRLQEALQACRARGGVTGRTLAACLEAAGRPRAEADRILDQALLQGALALERFLGTLAVLGTLAPFLGLLGTVTGMIRTFSSLTAAAGGGGSSMLAGGIAEALITTEFGLITAIPLVLLHSILSGRAERIQADLEEAGARLALAAPAEGEED